MSYPILKTKSLVLRRLEESDVNEIFYLRSDVVVNQFIKRPIERQTKKIDDALTFIKMIGSLYDEGKSVIWGICTYNENTIIGTICLWNFSADGKTAEVGYDLATEFHGKGIMSEALQAVIAYGFDIRKFEIIEAYTQKDNLKSTSLLLRNGFELQENRKCSYNPKNVVFLIMNGS